MCLYPRLLPNPKYRANKKNGGNIPAVSDRRVLLVPIACKECKECRKAKQREWTIRLREDIKDHKNGHMIALTFNTDSLKELTNAIKEEVYKNRAKNKQNKRKELIIIPTGYELDNAICTLAVRRWTERWRKKYNKTIRHFLITELGQTNTEHVHMHGFVWTDEPIEEVRKIWGYGNIWAGYDNKRTYVNARSINYTVKYITKIDIKHKHYKQIILNSNGIGEGYKERIQFNNHKYIEGRTNEHYTTETGHKMAMPMYLRNKIYTEEEREKLWIEKLNKNVRYINGQKIDVSKNEKEYREALKYAQEQNIAQGYGNGNIDWNERNYEQQRRKLIQEKRIGKET